MAACSRGQQACSRQVSIPCSAGPLPEQEAKRSRKQNSAASQEQTPDAGLLAPRGTAGDLCPWSIIASAEEAEHVPRGPALTDKGKGCAEHPSARLGTPWASAPFHLLPSSMLWAHMSLISSVWRWVMYDAYSETV